VDDELRSETVERKNRPTHIVVPYQTPHARAFATAQNAAVGFAVAVGLIVLPIAQDYFRKGVFGKGETVAMLTAIGSGVLGVILTYCVKYVQAHGSDLPPTLSPLGVEPIAESSFSIGTTDAHLNMIGQAVMLPSLPTVDPALLADLVNRTIRDSLDPTHGIAITTPSPQALSGMSLADANDAMGRLGRAVNTAAITPKRKSPVPTNVPTGQK
jgi:hypothetical protein